MGGVALGVEVVLMHGVSVLVLITVLACAACGGSDSEQTGGVPPPPEVGQCHNTPESSLNAAYDDSPVVDCSQPHTLQTLKVIDTDEEVTPELLEQLAKYCHAQAVAEYIDSPGAGGTTSSIRSCSVPRLSSRRLASRGFAARQVTRRRRAVASRWRRRPSRWKARWAQT